MGRLHGKDWSGDQGLSGCCGRLVAPEALTDDPDKVTCALCHRSPRFRKWAQRVALIRAREAVAVAVETGLKLGDTLAHHEFDRMPYVMEVIAIDPKFITLRQLTRSGQGGVDRVEAVHLVGWLKYGTVWHVSVARLATGEAMSIDLTWDSGSEVMRSEVGLRLADPGVWHEGFVHTITGHVGACCEETRVHLHLSADPTVISAQPTAPRRVYPIAMTDVIMVRGAWYRIEARRHSEPLLIPLTVRAD